YSVRRIVPKQRLIVAVIVLPLLYRGLGDALGAKMHACHVIGAVDDEELLESNRIHSDENRDGIERSADNRGDHSAAARSPRRQAPTPGTTPATTTASTPIRGQMTGCFPSRRFSARRSGSMRMYLTVLFAIAFGFRLWYQA